MDYIVHEEDQQLKGITSVLERHFPAHVRRRSCYCSSCGGEWLQKKDGYQVMLESETQAIMKKARDKFLVK